MADMEDSENILEISSRGIKRTGNHDNKESTKAFPLRKKTRKERGGKKREEERGDSNKGFSDDILNETSYVFHNGFRYVVPYYFKFSTHAKGRWVGRKVFDIFCEEFQSETPQYYEKAIRLGNVTVNRKVATMETVVKDNDLVTHLVHRHEPPVTSRSLTIIHEDSEILVVDKPPSIPVHPCGRYRHNTVVFILAKEYKMRNIHNLHRLDRLTSGLLMFGKTLSRVQQMEKQIRDRTVTKEYLALVKGHFPKESVECNEPIRVESHKLGVCHVDRSGKPCSTTFTLVSYNEDRDTSLLRCQPKTGRMHQIRVHLQWLGYPIMNDPLYDHPAWGPNRGKGGKTQDDMKTILIDLIKSRFGGVSTGEDGGERGEKREVEREREGEEEREVEEREGNEEREKERMGEGESVGDQKNEEKKEKKEGEEEGEKEREREGESMGDQKEEEKKVEVEREEEEMEEEKEMVGEKKEEEYKKEQEEREEVREEKKEKEKEDEKEKEKEERDIIQSGVCHDTTLTSSSSLLMKSSSSDNTMIPQDDEETSQKGKEKQETNIIKETKTIEKSSEIISSFPINYIKDPNCTECHTHHTDPTHDEFMYLHALRYQGDGWEFETDSPDWALDYLELTPQTGPGII